MSSAADRERNEHLARRAPHDVDHGFTRVAARGDVEKNQLIRPLRIVLARDFDRVAGVDEIDEIDALHHSAAGHVQAGDDAFCEHSDLSFTLFKSDYGYLNIAPDSPVCTDFPEISGRKFAFRRLFG